MKDGRTGSSAGFGLEEESKRMSGKIKELQMHMMREKGKRMAEFGSGTGEANGALVLNDTLASFSASPEVECVVMMFLKNCGMEKYYDAFISNQIHDLPTLKSLTESSLEALKIPIGHRLKILKNLRTFLNSDTTESNKINPPVIHENTKLKDIVPTQPFFQLTESTPIRRPLLTKDPTETSLSYSIQAKVPCWQCLRVHPEPDSIKNYNKNFCSETCLVKFESTEKKTCTCGNTFLRKQGIFYKEMWICNLCAEKIDY